MRRTAGRATAATILMLLLGACATSQVGSGPATGKADGPASGPASCLAAHLALRYGPALSPMTGEHGVLYALVNRGRTACRLAGYPGITIYDAAGTPMKFRYTHHSEYLSPAAPRPVTLRPGASAYLLVAKYRCDLGVVSNAVRIRLTLPGPDKVALAGRVAADGLGVSELSYCRGGPNDPGQTVGVSPIARTIQDAGPLAGH